MCLEINKQVETTKINKKFKACESFSIMSVIFVTVKFYCIASMRYIGMLLFCSDQ